MSDALKLYNLQPSPNNMKARIALAYKGLKYEKIDVHPQERATVIEVSGQPLTPVLTHGNRVIFDSAAILRYLDANFRDTPRIFSADYHTMQQIERWEAVGRNECIKAVGMIFGQLFAETKDFDQCIQASHLLHSSTAKVEETLQNQAWLVGDSMSAADITIAPAVFYGMLPQQVAEGNPLAKFFYDHLKLGEGREKTREWVMRVMAYDN